MEFIPDNISAEIKNCSCQFIPDNMNAASKDCIGCQRYKKDIMITATIKDQNGDTDFVDIFLSQDQAIQFHKDLAVAILQNKFNKEL